MPLTSGTLPYDSETLLISQGYKTEPFLGSELYEHISEFIISKNLFINRSNVCDGLALKYRFLYIHEHDIIKM